MNDTSPEHSPHALLTGNKYGQVGMGACCALSLILIILLDTELKMHCPTTNSTLDVYDDSNLPPAELNPYLLEIICQNRKSNARVGLNLLLIPVLCLAMGFLGHKLGKKVGRILGIREDKKRQPFLKDENIIKEAKNILKEFRISTLTLNEDKIAFIRKILASNLNPKNGNCQILWQEIKQVNNIEMNLTSILKKIENYITKEIIINTKLNYHNVQQDPETGSLMEQSEHKKCTYINNGTPLFNSIMNVINRTFGQGSNVAAAFCFTRDSSDKQLPKDLIEIIKEYNKEEEKWLLPQPPSNKPLIHQPHQCSPCSLSNNGNLLFNSNYP